MWRSCVVAEVVLTVQKPCNYNDNIMKDSLQMDAVPELRTQFSECRQQDVAPSEGIQ